MMTSLSFQPDSAGLKASILKTGFLNSLVKPTKPVNNFVSTLTGITTEMVADAPPFPEVAKEFFAFISQQFADHEQQSDKTIRHIVIVAHNGRAFDMPFLCDPWTDSTCCRFGRTILSSDS